MISPGMSSLKDPSPSSTLVEKQHNLASTNHHKSYTNFHNLNEGTSTALWASVQIQNWDSIRADRN